MVSVDGLTVEFSGTTLFKDISFVINDKDRIALMGKNGAGKSTMLKILAGVKTPNRGKVTVTDGGKIGYLPQHLMVENGRTVFEEACLAFEHLFEIEREIEKINNELTTRTDYDSDDYMALIEKVTALSEKFYRIDMTNYQEDVERTLMGLGFVRSDLTRQTSEFSGGWRMRIELAKIILQKPTLLLLDEPTNHLDMKTKDILKQAIKDFNGTVIVVSHDREFLDGLVEKVYEFGGGKVKECLGGIYDFLEKKKLSSLTELELSKSTTKDSQTISNNNQSSNHSFSTSTQSHSKLSYAEQKEREKLIKRVKKAVVEAEAEISQIELQIEELENKIATGEYTQDIFDEHAKMQKQLEEAMTQWELASIELEKFEV